MSEQGDSQRAPQPGADSPNDDAGPSETAARAIAARDADERPLGVSLLVWLYWFWAGAITLVLLGFAIGEGPVPMSGETIPRAEALSRVLPVLVPMGLAVLGAALALSLRRAWARPAVLLPVALAAFGPALSGVASGIGDMVLGALALLPILAALVWYLYFRSGVTAYFARLKAEEEAGPGA